MEALSAEYGWTPQQIKQMTYSEVKSYLKILYIKRKLEERELKKRNGR